MSHAGDPNAPPPGENEAPTATAPLASVAAVSAAPEASDDDDNRGNTIDPNLKSADADAEDDGPSPGNELHPAPAAAEGAQGAQGRREKKNRDGKGRDGKDRPARQNAGQNPGQGGGQRPRGDKGGADPHRSFKVGDKVRAKVVELSPVAVLCDLWGKEKGVLDLRELAPDLAEVQVGDMVDVIVLQDGARGGNLVVTRDAERAQKGKEFVAQAHAAGEPIEALVTGFNKGGLELDVNGVRGFCPASQIDVRMLAQPELQALVLKRELFKIVQITDGGREVVLSRRALREGEVKARAEEAIKAIKIGDVVKGRVVAVRDHGIFLDLGGVEGRIQLTELSHDRGTRPQDVARIGDELEAKVLRIDIPVERPAAPAAEAAPEAAPAETAPAAEAAPATDEASAEGGRGKRGDKKPQRFSRLPEGTPRVELSRRAVLVDPWQDVHKRYAVGSLHRGKVARMQEFGAFIELEKGVDGLLHVSEIGEKRIKHPNEVLKDAQEVHVRVSKVDRGQRRIALTLVPEGMTEEDLKQSVQPRVGLVTTAKIVEHDAIGVWAQLTGAIGKLGRGLIPPPDTNQPRGADLKKALPVGQEVRVKVVEFDRGRLKLSIRAALQDEERQAYRAYQASANATTVGTSLADKLKKLSLSK